MIIRIRPRSARGIRSVLFMLVPLLMGGLGGFGEVGPKASAQAAAPDTAELVDDPGLESPLEKLEERAGSFRMFQKPKDGSGDEDDDSEGSDASTKPPFELYRTQVAPFEVLPLIKSYHWSWMVSEMSSNLEDFNGILQTEAIPLPSMPRAVTYRREAALTQEQLGRLGMPIRFGQLERTTTLSIELARPESIRPASPPFVTTIQRLRAAQMLVAVLSDEPETYTTWRRFRAMIPRVRDLDSGMLDRYRYYRMVTVSDPETIRPLLPEHPLTWSTISHVLWDGLDFNELNLDQRQGLLTWLRFGGQIVLVANGPNADLLADRSSPFVGETPADDLLPASMTGRVVRLEETDLRALSRAYPPPMPPQFLADWMAYGRYQSVDYDDPLRRLTPMFRPGQPVVPYFNPPSIRSNPDQPVELALLEPKPGTQVIRIQGTERILAVERRVGRGRITMLALDPGDPTLESWEGLDTLVRRVVLRRVEESASDWSLTASLDGPQLSTLRYMSRDLDAPIYDEQYDRDEQISRNGETRGRPRQAVAAWVDDAGMPKTSRNLLRNASGLTIPERRFVILVVLGYCVALVPLNFLICQYLFRRRELAWLLAPLLALGFAVGVERLAALDLGYDVAVDEIDLIELQGDYGQAHLSRFGSILSTGRFRFTISYPQDPSALVLPMTTGTSLRNESRSFTQFQSQPFPALTDFEVQPRSIDYFRAEQMISVGGSIGLTAPANGDGDSGPSTTSLANRTNLILRDATLVDVDGRRMIALGTLVPGAVVAVPSIDAEGVIDDDADWIPLPDPRDLIVPSDADANDGDAEDDGAVSRSGNSRPIDPNIAREPLDRNGVDPELLAVLDPRVFLGRLRAGRLHDPTANGELRLVAWTDQVQPGQVIEPAPDRIRGLSLVVVHLRFGPPPNPDGEDFDQSRIGR